MASNSKLNKDTVIPGGKHKGMRLCELTYEDLYWKLFRAVGSKFLYLYLYEYKRRGYC